MNEKHDNIAHPGMLSKPEKSLIVAQFSNSPLSGVKTARVTLQPLANVAFKSASLDRNRECADDILRKSVGCRRERNDIALGCFPADVIGSGHKCKRLHAVRPQRNGV